MSVVMPLRNEGEFAARSLRAVLGQDWPQERLEVLIVDGASDDDTLERMDAVRREFPAACVTTLSNALRITPVSLNQAIRAAAGDVIVRVDGHCEIQPGYLRGCWEALRSTGADNVGGPCVTVGETATARAIATAQSSRFGVGGVAFRVGRGTPGPVDTVPFGAWPRRVFDEFGLFDEELVRNQDDEHNLRIIQGGGTVWYEPAIRSTYFSRATFKKLGRQYFEYGSYKVRVMQKRRGFASVRHLVPGGFVGAMVGSLAAALVTGRSRWMLFPSIPYAVACAVATRKASRHQAADPARVLLAFLVLHTAYGVGFWHGVWRWRAEFRHALSRPVRLAR